METIGKAYIEPWGVVSGSGVGGVGVAARFKRSLILGPYFART